jgi:hypothetical protein
VMLARIADHASRFDVVHTHIDWCTCRCSAAWACHS